MWPQDNTLSSMPLRGHQGYDKNMSLLNDAIDGQQNTVFLRNRGSKSDFTAYNSGYRCKKRLYPKHLIRSEKKKTYRQSQKRITINIYVVVLFSLPKI